MDWLFGMGVSVGCGVGALAVGQPVAAAICAGFGALCFFEFLDTF